MHVSFVPFLPVFQAETAQEPLTKKKRRPDQSTARRDKVLLLFRKRKVSPAPRLHAHQRREKATKKIQKNLEIPAVTASRVVSLFLCCRCCHGATRDPPRLAVWGCALASIAVLTECADWYTFASTSFFLITGSLAHSLIHFTPSGRAEEGVGYRYERKPSQRKTSSSERPMRLDGRTERVAPSSVFEFNSATLAGAVAFSCS